MDVWSDWLLRARHGGDAAYGRVVQGAVAHYADRLLDAAPPAAGMTLIDLGAGEGLVAFRALERVGAELKVILTDISQPMLRHAESVAMERGIRSHCTFLECSAERLEGIADESADLVTARASLAYVADKQAAFREISRVLKPGGRFSVAEPILQDDAFYARALRNRIDGSGPPADRYLILMHRWKAAQFPDTEQACAANPLTNFSERDLLNIARSCGFVELHLQLHVDVTPSLISSWEVFIEASPHPWAPSLARILAEQFTPDERAFFEKILRPTIESGKSVTVDRVVYMQGAKPAGDSVAVSER